MSRRLALVVNPAASGGRAVGVARAASRELDRIGTPHRTIETTSAEHAGECALAAAAASEATVAVGGDGLVGTLAGALRGSDGALAVVPAGRGNDFARVLGIPSDPAGAARVAADGAERLLDVADADGRAFVGIASVGFDSDANRIANDARLVRGNLVYLYAALRALAAWRPATFDVDIDGRRHRNVGYSVAVANSKAYGGGMYVVPHAQLDDGRLDVMLSAASSKLHFLSHLPQVFKGTHVTDPYLTFLAGESVSIAADRPFTVYADGDPIAELPVKITVARQALRMIVPAW